MLTEGQPDCPQKEQLLSQTPPTSDTARTTSEIVFSTSEVDFSVSELFSAVVVGGHISATLSISDIRPLQRRSLRRLAVRRFVVLRLRLIRCSSRDWVCVVEHVETTIKCTAPLLSGA